MQLREKMHVTCPAVPSERGSVSFNSLGWVCGVAGGTSGRAEAGDGEDGEWACICILYGGVRWVVITVVTLHCHPFATSNSS